MCELVGKEQSVLGRFGPFCASATREQEKVLLGEYGE